MKTEYTGIYTNGGVSFDAPLNLPENTRVVVREADANQVLSTPKPIELPAKSNGSKTKEERIAAVRKFLDVASQTPIPHEHIKYSRDELYERD